MKSFHLGAVSGIVTAAAANAVLFAWRNSSLTNVQYVQSVIFKVLPIVPPTVEQEFAVQMNLESTFSANYSGGQDLSDPATAANYAIRNRNTDVQRAISLLPVSVAASANIMIASTSALTAGGGDVIQVHPWTWTGAVLPVTAAESIQMFQGRWDNPFDTEDHQNPQRGCIPLLANTGFILRTPVALANSLTFRLAVEVDWLE